MSISPEVNEFINENLIRIGVPKDKLERVIQILRDCKSPAGHPLETPLIPLNKNQSARLRDIRTELAYCLRNQYHEKMRLPAPLSYPTIAEAIGYNAHGSVMLAEKRWIVKNGAIPISDKKDNLEEFPQRHKLAPIVINELMRMGVDTRQRALEVYDLMVAQNGHHETKRKVKISSLEGEKLLDDVRAEVAHSLFIYACDGTLEYSQVAEVLGYKDAKTVETEIEESNKKINKRIATRARITQ